MGTCGCIVLLERPVEILGNSNSHDACTSYLFIGFLNFKGGKNRHYLVYRFASKKECSHFLCVVITPPPKKMAEFVMIRLLKKILEFRKEPSLNCLLGAN